MNPFDLGQVLQIIRNDLCFNNLLSLAFSWSFLFFVFWLHKKQKFIPNDIFYCCCRRLTKPLWSCEQPIVSRNRDTKLISQVRNSPEQQTKAFVAKPLDWNLCPVRTLKLFVLKLTEKCPRFQKYAYLFIMFVLFPNNLVKKSWVRIDTLPLWYQGNPNNNN